MPLDDTTTPVADPAAQWLPPMPGAVRRAAQRADEMVREIRTPVAEGEPAPVEPAAPPVADAPPITTPAPAAPAAPAQPTDAEQKYATLQGKYDSETREMRAQIARLEQLIATVQAPQPTPAPEPAPAPAPAPEIAGEDVEAYGRDLIDAVCRWVDVHFSARFAALESRLASLGQQQTQSTAKSAQNTVEAALERDPELRDKWRAQNEDPEFIAWLQGTDTFTGRPRLDFFREACRTGDAPRVVAFFKAFLNEHTAAPTPTPPAAPETPPAPAAVAGAPTLESLAAPGRIGGSAPVGAPPAKRVWTRPEITRFYNDKAHGNYKHREAEAGRIEADIHAAIVEGRIR